MLYIPLTLYLTVILSRSISPTSSYFEKMFRLICSSTRLPLMQVNCLSTRMFVTLNPHYMQNCLTFFIDSCSVVASELAMYSATLNFRCLDIVFMKKIPLMNRITPASIISLYISRMVIRMGKIDPMMCGIFVLGSFLLGIQDSPPKCIQLL